MAAEVAAAVEVDAEAVVGVVASMLPALAWEVAAAAV
jgi:hypothetical protein